VPAYRQDLAATHNNLGVLLVVRHYFSEG
jgi:hypothetical protein